MKILIFSAFFYPHTGGVEQYALEVSTRLAKSGHDVTVVTSMFDNLKCRDEINKVKIARVSSLILLGGNFPLPYLGLKNHHALRKLFQEKPDLIITNTRFYLLTLLALFYANMYKVPSYHIEHGACYSKLNNKVASTLSFLYDNTFGRLVFMLADHHVAVSNAAAKFSEKLGGRHVEVLYNSIDLKDFALRNQDYRHDRIYLLFIGRLIESKGIQDLINAVKLLNDLPITLTIVGTGNYRSALEHLSGNSQNIQFIGEKRKEEIIGLLNKHDIFINPSYSEGLPTSVMEAGAAMVPVIATDVGGTGEIIDNNENGFLIPPHNPAIIAEKIRILVASPHMRDYFSKNLRDKIDRQFTWDTTMQKLESIIHKSPL